jgi:molybdate transport system substrate-binding protein
MQISSSIDNPLQTSLLWPKFGSALTAVVVAAAMLTSCGMGSADNPNNTVTLRVGGAADLQFALAEIAPKFEGVAGREEADGTGLRGDGDEAHRVKVETIYGSSGNLYSQIVNGAPFDVYMSADMHYVERLVREGRVEQSDTFMYAMGRLAVYVRADSPLDVSAEGITAVADPRVKRVAVANPDHAPYGRAAVETLVATGLYDTAKDKFVVGENVMQAAHLVESGAADIGIIAVAIAKAPTVTGRFWLVPKELHSPLRQGGALLTTEGTQSSAAKEFVSFVTGPQAQEIFARYGFELPDD